MLNGVKHVFSKREYIDVNKSELVEKYNRLLTKCYELESQLKLQKKVTRHYRNKLENINELSKCGSESDSS